MILEPVFLPTAPLERVRHLLQALRVAAAAARAGLAQHEDETAICLEDLSGHVEDYLGLLTGAVAGDEAYLRIKMDDDRELFA